MNETIKIKYYVADGYAGGDRPKFVTAAADDFEGCETDEEVMDRAAEIVDDHFRQNVFPEIDTEDFNEAYTSLKSTYVDRSE